MTKRGKAEGFLPIPRELAASFIFFLTVDVFIDFREVGGENEREGETSV